MTKQELREYRALKMEVAQLACLSVENGDEPKLHELYSRKLDQCRAKLLEIERAIDALQARERVLLRAYYVRCMTWEDVAEMMSYDVRQVHRIHGWALRKLDK